MRLSSASAGRKESTNRYHTITEPTSLSVIQEKTETIDTEIDIGAQESNDDIPPDSPDLHLHLAPFTSSAIKENHEARIRALEKTMADIKMKLKPVFQVRKNSAYR
ncbi:uncharacterized protein [Temnothorax longispinosus]|uniref:uncharacterized protein n=1 Tax=Temnothorax longispinosus TaxID=300112 RepID=UPI003A997963